MTWSAVGTWHGAHTAALSLSNQAVGNLLIVEVANFSGTVYCTGLTGGGANWTLITHFQGTTNSQTMSLFFGTVTATGSQTATPTWSGATPSGYGIAAQEFNSTVGSWTLDKIGTLDVSSSSSFASLTPANGAGELYFGYAVNSGIATAGSTSGYTYNASVDGAQNGAAYNVSCPNSATAPGWGDSGENFGIMVLVAEGTEWSVLQSASGASATLTATATFPKILTNGSKLIAYVSVANGSTPSTVKDSANNSFTQIATVGTTQIIRIYVLDTPSGDVGTTTTITATCTGTANGMALLVQEVDSLASGTSCLDGTAGTNHNQNTVTSGGTSIGLGAYSSTAANEFLVIFYGDNGDSVGLSGATTPSGYTADSNNITGSSDDDLLVFYKNSTGGTESPTSITVSDTSNLFDWATCFVAFKLFAGASPSVTTVSLPEGYIGASYSATLQAAGGTTPYSWSISSGSLPGWASLNSSTGVISGTVTGTPTTTSFTVTVTDANSNTGTANLSISTEYALSLESAWPGFPAPGVFVPGQLIITSSSQHFTQTLIAIATATGSQSRSIGKQVPVPVAVTGNVTRNIARIITVPVAMVPQVMRTITRTFITLAVATGIIFSTKVKTVLLAAQVAATAAVTRSVSKVLTGPVAVSPGVSRFISKTVTGTAATVSSVTRQITHSITANITVNSSVTRKVLRILTGPVTIVSGTTRTIGRPIQGTLVIAGQTVRSIGRVVSTQAVATATIKRTAGRVISPVIVVSGKVTRSIGFHPTATITMLGNVSRGFTVKLATIISAVGNVTAASASILGTLFIIIPGSCAKIVKGLFTQTLPKLIMKLTGFPGTFSTFNIIIPGPTASITAGRNRLAIKLPSPKTSLTGRVYPPLTIQLPAVKMTITGTRNHVGGFNIDFGDCFSMWRYLMEPVELPPVISDEVQWTVGSSQVRWNTDIAWSRWSFSTFTGIQLPQIATDYIRVGVTALFNGTKHNPTGDAVKFAFMQSANQVPQTSDWVTGSWETTSSLLYPYKARCLIGPNGVTNLGPGSYIVYIQVSDNPETVVSPLGTITVF